MLIIPATAITVKRFNDRDWPNWLGYAVGLAGALFTIGPHFGFLAGPEVSTSEGIALLIILLPILFAFIDNGFLRGTSGPNRYGPDPDPLSSARPKAPSRWWYLGAVAIALAGFAGSVTLIGLRSVAMVDELIQVVVPGEAELTLREPGTYMIFHEQRYVVGDRLYVSDNIFGLRVAVQSATTGKEIPIAPTATSETYEMGGRSGVSAFAFDIPEPGRYRLVAAYEDGRAEPLAVLAVGHDFIARSNTTILGSLAIMFTCIAVAIVMVVVVLRRRSAARAG